MAFQNITLNLTALTDITPLNITVNETSLSDVISIANSSSDNMVIYGSLAIIFVVIYIALSDKTPLQNFGYNDARSISLALSACSLIGISMVSVGWSPNFKAVGIFITAWILSLIIISLIENKE